MTPAARVAAAIGLLDRALAGEPAEAALTRWARASRYAGSGDRAAVRDLVYDSLRRLRSRTALAGADRADGRALMIGALREAGADPADVFTGAQNAPQPLTPSERDRPPREPTLAEALDLPDWLVPALEASLGDAFAPVAAALRDRAPVVVRANAARLPRDEAQRDLAAVGIGSVPHPLVNCGLQLTDNAGKLRNSPVYLDGRVEVQDAGPQAACERLAAALPPRARVLDYCAGGGGKALALAALGLRVSAHDASPARMRDLPARAARAGVRVPVLDRAAAAAQAPWDAVVLDVPCSGSGTWRRTPEAKWRLTAERVRELCAVQAGILEETRGLVGRGGVLCYMTCSLLEAENGDRVRAFLSRHPGWTLASEDRFTPLDGADGFYAARLTRR